MSEPATPDNSDATAEKPKKSRKLIFIIMALVLLVAVGGGGFFYARSAGANEAEKKPSAKKKKQARDDEEPDEKASDEDEAKTSDDEEAKSSGEAGKKRVALDLPDDSEVKHIVELQPFIVNLADHDEGRYLRLTVSLGLGGEEAEKEKPDVLFTTRVRNAMLAVLTNKTSAEVLSAEGKAALRKELLRAARAVSDDPPVEAIYITDFIVQL